MAYVTLENLSFQYPDAATFALRGISLTLEQGDFAVLCGSSGSGKTTLLRLLKPQLRPHGDQSGSLRIGGKAPDALSPREASANIGFVAQDPQTQLVSDKVLHELAFGAEGFGLPPEELRRRVAETATYFGITDWLHRDVNSLSGGEQQLLVLASVMLTRPSLLLLDEPTSQLDPHAATVFLGWLQTIRRDFGTTILLSEHRLEDVLPLCDRVFVLEDGALTAQGTPRETVRQLYESQSPFLAAMPAASRLWAALNGTGDPPCSVAEGRAFLEHYLLSHTPSSAEPPTADAAGNPALELKEASFRYEKDAPDVLRDLSLTAHRGELLCLLGANGSGKTTLLQLIAGVRDPQHGTLQKEGSVALLPQQPQDLFWHESVREELLSVAADDDAYQTALRRFRLSPFEYRHPETLSGGEAQRLALAKLLLTQPDILLLDEPTKGLDAVQKASLAALLRECCRDGMCVVVVSHDVAFCAAYADGCALLFDGAVCPPQPPRVFFTESRLYTTATARITRGLLPGCVTVRDVCAAFGTEEPALPAAEEPEPTATETPAPAPARKPGRLRKALGTLSLCGALVCCFFAAKTIGFQMLFETGARISLSAKQWAVCGGFAACLLLAVLLLRSADTFSVKLTTTAPRGQTVFSAVWLIGVLPAEMLAGLHFCGVTQYYLLSLILLVLGLLPFFIRFERRRPSARAIAVLAALCALAIAGRTAFFMLPQFKPVLAIVILAGAALGAESGFLVGAVTMLLSNLLFAQGPWTPFQMFAMGAAGALAGVLARCGLLTGKRLPLCLFGAVCAVFLYGGIMNPAAALLWGGEALNRAILLSYYATGLPMDLIHAAATVLFLWVLSPTILTQLTRLQTKYGPLV